MGQVEGQMMRRALGAVAVAAACLVGAACEPTPPTPPKPPAPAVKYTARGNPTRPTCSRLFAQVDGNIPEGAPTTSRVVLQRTVNGKWADWKWVDDSDYPVMTHLLTDVPDRYTGDYRIDFRLPNGNGTYHLRARSNGGSVVSNDVYISRSSCP